MVDDLNLATLHDQARIQALLIRYATVLDEHAGRGAYLGQTMTVWGQYSDRLERRAEGWRIVERSLQIQLVSGDVGVQLKA